MKKPKKIIAFLAIALACSLAVALGTDLTAEPPPREPEPVPVARLANMVPADRLYPYPEEATYPEISAEAAVRLYNLCRPVAGLEGESAIADLEVIKALSFSEGCNVYHVKGGGLELEARSSDARILNLHANDYYPAPPGLLPVSVEEARRIGEEMYRRLNNAEDDCLAAIPDFQVRERAKWAFGEVTLQHICDLDEWVLGLERVSETGIPYAGQAGCIMLRFDGLFISAGVHEPEPCTDTEPLVSEEEALAIGRGALDERLDEQHPGLFHNEQDIDYPDMAQLIYMATSIWPEPDPDAYVTGAITPVESRINRLTWLITSESSMLSITVDAMTGEIVDFSLG